jgi:hypothetical protein
MPSLPAARAAPAQLTLRPPTASRHSYVDRLRGVLLSYSNLRLKHPYGRISHDTPEVHVRAQFDATYYAPRVGDLIEGVVSLVGGDHIALLALGIFNAAVPPPTGAAHEGLCQDDSAAFVVRSVTHSNGLLSMHGELVDPGSYRPYVPPAKAAAPSSSVPSHKQRAAAAARPSAAPTASTPASATPNPAAEATGASSSKPRRSPEEKEEKRRRKAAKAAKAAAAAAGVADAAAAAGTPEEKGMKRKRTKEEKEEKRRRKAARAAAATP